MRYAQVLPFEVCNGEGVGISLFIQGCHFHCIGCFNQEAWDFNGGKKWTKETKKRFLELIDKPYIKRISFLGGEPLAKENLNDVLDLVNEIKTLFPDKLIWLYTGYTWEDCTARMKGVELDSDGECNTFNRNNQTREDIISKCDILVDGCFEEDKKDLTLKFRGSSNQRLIDVKKTKEKGEIVLWAS